MHAGAKGSGGPEGACNGNYKHGRHCPDNGNPSVGEGENSRTEGVDQDASKPAVSPHAAAKAVLGRAAGAHAHSAAARLLRTYATTDRTSRNGCVESKVIARHRTGVSGWWLHDLRRTLATGLQRLRVRLEVTEAVLNHLSGSRAGVVGIYQRHD
jgi:hypothetical protein